MGREHLGEEWHTEVLTALAGVMGTFCVTVAVLKTNWWRFWYSAPEGSLYEQHSYQRTQLLLGFSIAVLVVMTPLYATTSG